jgi:polyisoprenoid-binding protein YceI
LTLCFFAQAKTWDIDSSHSTTRFKIQHLTISKVSGEITGIKGKIDIDPKDVTKTKAEASIDASTVNTNDKKRDEHLKGSDFFDVKKFPAMTFKSKKIVKGDGGKFQLVGDLTLRGVTKEITLDSDGFSATVKDPWGNEKMAFSAKGAINRMDFGMTWNKALDKGGLVLGEKADIEVEFELLAAK